MGTRSLTTFSHNEESQPFAAMYRQFDGYPSGHGAELKVAFGDYAIVNGITGDTPERAANGMGCFGARVVAHFKNDIGGFYLDSPTSIQEYNYHLYPNGQVVFVKCTDSANKLLYQGPLSEMPVDA